MRKIISLFQRNYEGDRLVRDEIVPGAEWVPAGEGVPTRKWDGVCAAVRGGKLFKRYELKNGRKPRRFRARPGARPHYRRCARLGAGGRGTGRQMVPRSAG